MNSIADIWLQFGGVAFMASLLVMLLGGFTKGVVGFALPMITISGVGSLMTGELAVLALLIPGLVTNIWQALRNGWAEAQVSLRKYWRIFLIMPVVLGLAAQLFTLLSEEMMFIVIGTLVVTFVLFELSGFRGRLEGEQPGLEVICSIGSGISGGLSGVWGPPIMAYLMARQVAKVEFVRVMGLVFMIGAVVLNLSHVNSGLLNSQSVQYSALMVLPALLGMWVGYQVQDRLNQERFRRVTLFVLLVAGVNLLRRGFF